MRPERPLALPGATAALGAGIIGGYALVGGSPGIGFPLTAVAVAGAVTVADRAVLRSRGSLVFGTLALALAGSPALRAAEWLVVIDLIAAVGCGVWAVSRIGTWTSLTRAIRNAIADSVLAPPRIAVILTAGVGPARRQRLRPILRGSAVGLGLLLVFGTLFVSADSAFARMTSDLLSQDWDATLWPGRAFVGVLVMGLAGGLILTRVRLGTEPHEDETGDPFAPRRGRLRDRIGARSEWIVPLALLDFLFASFVVVQIAVLFGGRDHVLESAGVTYAEYARSGFFQLLAVAVLTLLVIAVAVHAGRPDDPRDKRWLQVLLGVLCICTLVILVSALQRLKLYEATFGFTRLRIAVHATILWLAALFTVVIAAGFRMKATWLPRAAAVFTGASLIAFTLLDPDAVIAEQNVKRYAATGKIDVAYLTTLSADAVPALAELPDDKLGCILPAFELRLSVDQPWTSANLARARARSVLQSEGAQPEDCAP